MNWEMDEFEELWIRHDAINMRKPLNLLVIMRIKNEEMIIEDTLNHISNFADGICVYDDCSTDATLEILKANKKVFFIIKNKKWREGADNRLLSETRHRGLLLKIANQYLQFKWCMCCDADERYIGDIQGLVEAPPENQPEGIRVQLFDAYMTPGNDQAFCRGDMLLGFRKYFGPECRNILMLWQNKKEISYQGLDAREPSNVTNVAIAFYCQHYGKSLSYEHWEETCNYYVESFPWKPYGEKWCKRKGKALHTMSDFNHPLYEWGESLFKNSITEF